MSLISNLSSKTSRLLHHHSKFSTLISTHLINQDRKLSSSPISANQKVPLLLKINQNSSSRYHLNFTKNSNSSSFFGVNSRNFHSSPQLFGTVQELGANLSLGDKLISSDENSESISNSLISSVSSVFPEGNAAHVLSDFPPVLLAQDLLLYLHSLPGLDWTLTILLTTLGIRLFVGLPISIIQQRAVDKLINLQPEFKEMGASLARETSIAVKTYGWSQEKANSVFKKSFKFHWRKLVEEHNCHPFRSIALVWLQLPFWITFSCALRNIVYCLPLPRTTDMMSTWAELSRESPSWVESLALPDPIILPLIFIGANLAIIQINTMRTLTVPQTRLQKTLPWVFRTLIVGLGAFATVTPSAVTLYWATSSVCVLVQNILFKSIKVKKFLKIR